MNFRGIEFQLIWFDQDVVEYQFTCSNGNFCGQARAYLSHDDIGNFAKQLNGFPSKLADSREFELGTFDPEYAGGGLRLRFTRLDSAGHSVVEVELRSDKRTQTQPRYFESVAMKIPVEAAAIDSFISEIEAIRLNVGAKAYLAIPT